MTKRLILIPGLGLLIAAGVGFAAEPLSEESLDKITAQGQQHKTEAPATMNTTSTISTHDQSHTILTIQSRSQTHLRGAAINNAAGVNQIGNGINIR